MTLDTNDTNDTHFCQRNQEKCDKSRLVTTSVPKHFIAKVAYFYPKSGVVLGASIYVIDSPQPPLKKILEIALAKYGYTREWLYLCIVEIKNLLAIEI